MISGAQVGTVLLGDDIDSLAINVEELKKVRKYIFIVSSSSSSSSSFNMPSPSSLDLKSEQR